MGNTQAADACHIPPKKTQLGCNNKTPAQAGVAFWGQDGRRQQRAQQGKKCCASCSAHRKHWCLRCADTLKLEQMHQTFHFWQLKGPCGTQFYFSLSLFFQSTVTSSVLAPVMRFIPSEAYGPNRVVVKETWKITIRFHIQKSKISRADKSEQT